MTSTIICCSDEVNGSGCFHWLIVAVLTDQPEWSLNTDDDNDVETDTNTYLALRASCRSLGQTQASEDILCP